MPIVKHISIYAAPKRLLEYVTNKNKTEGTFVTGLNCSADSSKAYEEMKDTFELFSRERFYKKSIKFETAEKEKQKIRLHHYIQSFKPGEVTPEEAHKIGVEWVKKVFGKNHQVVVATHIDKGHIHNHFAVSSYDMDGKHWISNKKTLQRCRNISDKIAAEHGLSVIENPKYKANHKYGEYKARRFGYSWKQNLCDEIDSIIMKENVRNIDGLISELEAKGYKVNRGKYLAVKVKPDRKAIRTYRLGDGYSLEHLMYRIENKNLEMPLSEALEFSGIQRDYALCIRQIQIQLYRKPERERSRFATYREIEKSSELLCYLVENNIRSVSELEKKAEAANSNYQELCSEKNNILKKITDEEKIIEEIPKYLELKNKSPLLAKNIKELAKYEHLKKAGVENISDIGKHKEILESLKSNLAETEENIRLAKEKKDLSENFCKTCYQTKTDYEILLEQAKAEIENMKKMQERKEREIQKHEKEQERSKSVSR